MTGEYLVLDGANALAIPTQRGQRMEVSKGRGSEIKWKSHDPDGEVWFTAVISLFDFKCEKTSDEQIGQKLTDILTESVRLNSDFLSKWAGLKVNIHSDFPLDWGLGSSSTLVFCISQWADADPYELYRRTFGGSGYDIACATAKGPIYYQLGKEDIKIQPASLTKKITDQMYFVYTGQKQNTAESVSQYRSLNKQSSPSLIKDISQISEELAQSKSIGQVEQLIGEHEKIISGLIKQPTIQSSRYSDYWGCVKSLGAWGGDFVLVTSDRAIDETRAYFEQKGQDVFIPWDDMVQN